MGIEPTSEAWEASILPLYDARSGENGSTKCAGMVDGLPSGRSLSIAVTREEKERRDASRAPPARSEWSSTSHESPVTVIHARLMPAPEPAATPRAGAHRCGL